MPEGWEDVQFKNFLTSTSYPIPKPNKPYTSLGIRSHCKGTLTRFVDNPENVAMDTLYGVKKEELIVNITFDWEGAIALLEKKDEGKLVSHRFPTYKFKPDKVIAGYFKHVIKTKRLVFNLGLISPGGTGRNRVFSKKDFLKLKWFIPHIKEQARIASILTTTDKEIEILNKELEALKQQKKGLMQRLLTGLIRHPDFIKEAL